MGAICNCHSDPPAAVQSSGSHVPWVNGTLRSCQIGVVIETNASPLLDWLLRKHPDTPKSRAKQWILAGRVSVNGLRARSTLASNEAHLDPANDDDSLDPEEAAE